MPEPAHRSSIRGLVLLLVGGGLFLYAVQRLLLPFVIAGVVAYVATPLIHWAHWRTGWPRAVPAVLFFLVFAAGLGLIGYFAGSALVEQVAPFLSNLQGELDGSLRQVLGDKPVRLFGQSIDAHEIAEKTVAAARDWFDPARVLTAAAIGIAGVFAGILFLVVLLYFLLTGPKVADGLFWLVPPDRRVGAYRLWSRIDPVLKRYFVGVAIVVACTSALAYLGLGLALRLPHAALLAVMTGVLEIVPVVGPAASAVIAGIVAIQSSKSLAGVLAYAAYATMLRVVVDNVIGPIVLGRAGRIHPVLVIFCFLVGGFLFGVVGVILAVPAALVVKTLIATQYDDTFEAEGGAP